MPHCPSPSIVTLVAAAALFGSSACAAPPIPYPDALAAAAVFESKLSDIHSLGLVVGNGEIERHRNLKTNMHHRIHESTASILNATLFIRRFSSR